MPENSRGFSIGVEISSKKAQQLHEFLLAEKLLLKNFRPLKSGSLVAFPVSSVSASQWKKIRGNFSGAKNVRKRFDRRKTKPRNMREALQGRLSKKELSLVPSAFDSLGDVAIIEVPKQLKGKENAIGEALLSANTSFESVYMKTGAHMGLFREEPVKLAAGKVKKFATYREHGCVFRISLGKVFFSPRLSTERKRISKLIKKCESVAALFAGVGPFPIVFAKNSGMGRAVAIELNPVAVEDMRHNIEANGVSGKVEAVLGDVKKLSKKYRGGFYPAVMPLPKGGESFLVDAIRFIKPSGGTVHYYQFSSRANPFAKPIQQVKAACAKAGCECRVLSKRKVRDYSPDTIQVVIDFRVSK